MSDLNINILPVESLNKLFGSSCNAIGQSAGAIFNFTFSWLIKANITKQKEFDDLTNGVAEKASKIPDEHLDDSKMDQVLKTIESSQYSISDKNIRNMYKNLISNSLDDRKNKDINNYFTTIISNLSPEAAMFLNKLYKNIKYTDTFPVIQIMENISDDSGSKLISSGEMKVSSSYFDTNVPDSFGNYSSILSILKSLGIVEISYTEWLTSDAWKNTYNDIFELYISNNKLNKDNISFNKGTVHITDLGKSFLDVVTD